jgi:hypothetical protein
MKIRYLAAWIITGVSLVLFNYEAILLVIFGIYLPDQHRWIGLSIDGIIALAISLSIRLTNKSVRWHHLILLALAWFSSGFCSFNILKWYGRNRNSIAGPIGLAVQTFFGNLTGQYRLEYFSFPLYLSVSFLFTGLLLRDVSSRLKLRHVFLLVIGGTLISYGRLFYIGQIAPDVAIPSRRITTQEGLIIRAIWAAAASTWLYAVLLRAGWGQTTSDPSPPLSNLKAACRPSILARSMIKKTTPKPSMLLLLAAIAVLSTVAYFEADQSRSLLKLLQRVAFFVPVILSTISGVMTARYYRSREMMELVRLTNLNRTDIFVGLLQITLYRIRWLLLASLGLFVALSLHTLTRFRNIYALQMGVPQILVIFAWIGVVVFGAASGIYAVFRFQSPTVWLLTPIASLVFALIILPIAFGETGPKGWITAAGNLVVFSALPYFGLHEILRLGIEA